MAYIKFQDDPTLHKYNNSFASLCTDDGVKNTLKLLDKCFVITNPTNVIAKFCCLQNFLYPVDGHLLIDFEVHSDETLLVYDNSLEDILPTSPSSIPANYPLGDGTEYFEITDPSSGPSGLPAYFILPNDRSYGRGCILFLEYPTTDRNGDDVLPENMSCKITTYTRELSSQTQYISQFFSHFANPTTRNANQLINRIEITNPNPNFNVKVTGLIVYVKSNNDPLDCGC